MKIKLFKNVQLPKKSHLPDCGLDCFMPESFELKPLETKTIGLGIGIQVPEGFAGMLVPRSSIAEKGLIIQTSIIDPDYTGEIHLIITNCSNNVVKIEERQRVCSLVVYNILNVRLDAVYDFENTERGSHGLGSSGK
jgi:dUTP pyrophosphatase